MIIRKEQISNNKYQVAEEHYCPTEYLPVCRTPFVSVRYVGHPLFDYFLTNLLVVRQLSGAQGVKHISS